jgi:hypothetical protein
MTDGRKIALAAGAIALLGAGGLAFLLASSGGRGAGLTSAVAEAPPPPQPARPDALAPAPSVADAGEPRTAAAPPGPVAAAPERPWSAVPAASRLSELGPLAPDVYAGLQLARIALEPCYQAADRVEANRPPRPDDEDAFGPAILMLELEARRGEVAIVGAPAQSLGNSTPELVECAERTLRGFRFAAEHAAPGKRYRYQYQLIP